MYEVRKKSEGLYLLDNFVWLIDELSSYVVKCFERSSQTSVRVFFVRVREDLKSGGRLPVTT